MTEEPKEKIYYDPKAVCEGCGHKGAFVYYKGNIFCAKCMGITIEIVIKPDLDKKETQ